MNIFGYYKSDEYHHHHQPINVLTTGAQAFLLGYTKGERAITYHTGGVRADGC
jgi:hypothetical protein